MNNQNYMAPLLENWDEKTRHVLFLGVLLPLRLEMLATQYPELYLSWASPSRHQVEKVRRRWQRHKHAERLDVHAFRGERLAGLNQRGYERVVMLNLFQVIQQRQAFLEGLRELLRPGAAVYLCETVDAKTQRLPGRLSINQMTETYARLGWKLEALENQATAYPLLRYFKFEHSKA